MGGFHGELGNKLPLGVSEQGQGAAGGLWVPARFVVELTVVLEKELKDTRLLLTTSINIQAN